MQERRERILRMSAALLGIALHVGACGASESNESAPTTVAAKSATVVSIGS